jgi:(p)ppGpp synthase/HD superfamily hydrolase
MNKGIDKKKYKKAIDYAFALHSNQYRKGTSIPYFTHLVSVSNNVIENGGNTDEVIAGLLHDAVEDQGGEKTLKLIKKRFGNKVGKIVEECSDTKITPKPPWLERKKKYLSGMKKSTQSSLFVSLCDKLHNATCIVNDYQRVGRKLWKRFNASPKQVYWYHNSLYKNFSKNLKGHKILKRNYYQIVNEMRKRVPRKESDQALGKEAT